MREFLKEKLFFIGSALFLACFLVPFFYLANQLPKSSGQHTPKDILLLPDKKTIKTEAERKQIHLYEAVKKGQKDEILQLLNEGISPNIKDSYFGWTPLHWAASQGQLETISTLLEKGAEVNAQDNNLWTPLHEAVSNSDLKTIARLLEQGADVNIQDKNLWTPLHESVTINDLKTAILLLEQGADVNKKDKNYWSPLELAKLDENKLAVKLLSKYNFTLKLKFLILCALLTITGALVYAAVKTDSSKEIK